MPGRNNTIISADKCSKAARVIQGKDGVIILSLVVLAFSLRVLVFLITDNGMLGEPWVRIRLALEWLQRGGFVSDVTGPVHIWVLGGIIRLWNDPLAAARGLNIILGSFFIIPFYALLRLIFGRRVALWSALLAAILPAHIKYSVISTGEALYVLLICCCFYFFFAFYKDIASGNIHRLVLSALCLNLAGGVRFEGWGFIPLLAFVLALKRVKYALIFLALCLISPVYWIKECHAHTGSFFPFITTASEVHREYLKIFHHTLYGRMASWIAVIFDNLSLFVGSLGFIGISYSLVKRKSPELALIFIYVSLLFIISALAGGFYPDQQYAFLPSLLLLPYAVLAAARTARFISGRIRAASVVVLFVLILSVFIHKMFVQLPGMRLNSGTKSVAEYLRKNASASDVIILDRDYSFGFGLPVLSGLKLNQFLWAPLKFENGLRRLDSEALEGMINRYKPRFITVFLDKSGYLQSGESGKLLDYFKLDPLRDSQEIGGKTFRAVLGVIDYKVYEISYRK